MKQGFSTIYHAQSNFEEKYNFSLKTFLRIYLSHEKTKANWPRYVKMADFCFNVLPHSRTGLSPFMLLFGRIPNDPITGATITPTYSQENYYDDVKARIKIFNEISKERRSKSVSKDKERRDQNATIKSFTPDEKVLVKVFARKTFDPLFEEATVIEDINDQNVKVLRRGKAQLLHKDHVFKTQVNSIPPAPTPPKKKEQDN